MHMKKMEVYISILIPMKKIIIFMQNQFLKIKIKILKIYKKQKEFYQKIILKKRKINMILLYGNQVKKMNLFGKVLGEKEDQDGILNVLV